jgi:hypothetical protein
MLGQSFVWIACPTAICFIMKRPINGIENVKTLFRGTLRYRAFFQFDACLSEYGHVRVHFYQRRQHLGRFVRLQWWDHYIRSWLWLCLPEKYMNHCVQAVGSYCTPLPPRLTTTTTMTMMQMDKTVATAEVKAAFKTIPIGKDTGLFAINGAITGA